MKRTNAVTEKWIHSFAVTDVCLHPKKFTVYKITSVVFPINIPEALTCLTVWKRFNDVKSLMKYVQKRHKEYKLPGIVPTLNNHVYFKRFEADVITERKLFIIRLLDYVAQHPILYKSQVFQDFFAHGQSMPKEEILQFDDEQITNSTNLMANEMQSSMLSASSSMLGSVCSMVTSSNSSLIDRDESIYSSNCSIDADTNTGDTMKPSKLIETVSTNESQESEDKFIETPVRPNRRDELSQFKVLKTIRNVMQVQDIHTKQIYFMKSIERFFDATEEIGLPANFPFMVALIAYYECNEFIYLLLEQASGGKLFDYIRSYSDEKSPAVSVNEPFKFPMPNIKIKPPTIPIRIPISLAKKIEATKKQQKEESFSHLLRSYYSKTPTQDENGRDCVDAIASPKRAMIEVTSDAPHFDLISNDPDIDNLLLCSKKLLSSVSNTLERIQTELHEDVFDLAESLFEDCDVDMAPELTEDRSDGESERSLTVETTDTDDVDDKANDLYEIRRFVQLPKAILKRWFREIIFAVKHLHANNIFCYDLQPDNLLLGKNGEVLLTYFYRREFTGYLDMQNCGENCYPIVYIAPERPLTQFSDVWSIGVIFYELATGHSFQSFHPNGIHSYYELQYPDECDLDDNTKDLIEGLLQVNPDHRLRLDEIEAHPFFIKI